MSVSLHVPLIGPLGINDSLPRPSTQVLGCCDIWMAGAGDIPLRLLGYGRGSKKENRAEDARQDAVFGHKKYYVFRKRRGNLHIRVVLNELVRNAV